MGDFAWGMSAGGQFDYEFASWKPERVVAFVVNKGGIYYTALTPRATREVPALLFIGGNNFEDMREIPILVISVLNSKMKLKIDFFAETASGHVTANDLDSVPADRR